MREICHNTDFLEEGDWRKVRYWILPYLMDHHDGNWEELSINTFRIMFEEQDLMHQRGQKRKSKNKLGRRQLEINEYVQPILQSVLAEMDFRGCNLQLKTKMDVYRDIILNPECYVHHGAKPDHKLTLKDLPKSNPNNSYFLKNVYKTKRTAKRASMMQK